MQPGTDEQLLLPTRVRPPPVLPRDVAFNRANVHEIVPTAQREAWHVHLVPMPRHVFQVPVLAIGRMAENGLIQADGIARIAGLLERHTPRRASAPVAEMKQA